MGLKESLLNLKLIAKNDKKVWFIAIFLLIVIVCYKFSSTPTRRTRTPQNLPTEVRAQQPNTLGADSTYKDLISAYGEDIESIKSQTAAQRQVVDRLVTDVSKDRKQFQNIFENVADRLDQIDTNFGILEEKIKNLNLSAVDHTNYESPTISASGPEVWGDLGVEQGPPPLPPQPLKMTLISPGDSVAVKLLTGVNAPVDGTPYPVLFQINSQINGPDGSMLDIGEARLLAAATGSETDSRALFRLTDLAIRHKDGRRSVVKIDGWIVGEDGIRGMRGILIDKLGRLIAATAGVSGVSALGEGIMSHLTKPDQYSDSQGITITTSNQNYALGKALTDASNRLGQVLIDRYEKLVPVVEILSGREVAAIFSQPAEIEILDESDESIYDTSLD
ncbi:MAG: TraB/VirB10 family protein [Deltaproteobacteria bacterium]|jgi:conjugal transfer pilus assembly protein TraB|nr:TraB/VirB10 family protein [Deltaproteobacteria bacterium]